ncbi:hypothetical protein NDU88_001648 [Pleurodeles waltl]|uniref:Uncharacterized protein n=1 Tax=Pleurodeles waltl TaxID=8319 RepID=A0AAV7S8L2_PLEWA|nr:hypothetical protein NDU88_001648 [Pleurodeles waltl]
MAGGTCLYCTPPSRLYPTGILGARRHCTPRNSKWRCPDDAGRSLPDFGPCWSSSRLERGVGLIGQMRPALVGGPMQPLPAGGQPPGPGSGGRSSRRGLIVLTPQESAERTARAGAGADVGSPCNDTPG